MAQNKVRNYKVIIIPLRGEGGAKQITVWMSPTLVDYQSPAVVCLCLKTNILVY